MRMSGGDSVTEHLDAFNTIIIQLASTDIKIIEEEKCISLLCSFLDSWDNLVMVIGRNNTRLNINDVVAALSLEEMKQKTMEGLTPKALSVRGLSIRRNKGKPSSGISKSRDKLRSRSMSPSQSTRNF